MKNLKRALYLKFARKVNKPSQESTPVPSIVSNNTKVGGDISSSGIIHIDGKVEGDIICEELVIGIKGMVVGSIAANNLQIYGVLQGKAKVDNLFIAKTAKLIGDATHNSIAIEPGAYIDGHVIHSTRKENGAEAATEVVENTKQSKK